MYLFIEKGNSLALDVLLNIFYFANMYIYSFLIINQVNWSNNLMSYDFC